LKRPPIGPRRIKEARSFDCGCTRINMPLQRPLAKRWVSRQDLPKLSGRRSRRSVAFKWLKHWGLELGPVPWTSRQDVDRLSAINSMARPIIRQQPRQLARNWRTTFRSAWWRVSTTRSGSSGNAPGSTTRNIAPPQGPLLRACGAMTPPNHPLDLLKTLFIIPVPLRAPDRRLV